MAGPAKKRAVSEKPAKKTDDQNDSSDDENESEQSFGEIQADFEGRNPEPEDFHGIKQLLHQLFLKAHVDLSQISDLLIAQNGVGSVLKQSADDDEHGDEDMEDDDDGTLDVFGITSVLNLSAHKEKECVKQIFALISDLAKEHATAEAQIEIERILKTNRLGLLLNERFLNIPVKISDPLLTCLEKEIEKIKKKEQSYNFDYYVMICKLHKEEEKGETNEECLYANAEEEIFVKEAKFQFQFNVTKESDTSVAGKWKEGDKNMNPYRQIIFFEGNQLGKIVKTVCSFVNQPNAVSV